MFDLRLKQKKRLLESGGPSCENIKKPKTSAKVHPGQGNSCGRELCVCVCMCVCVCGLKFCFVANCRTSGLRGDPAV